MHDASAQPVPAPPVHRPPDHAVSVRVPATSANLGPGFDTLGLAVGLHNTVTVIPSPQGTPAHLAVVAYEHACRAAGVEPLSVRADVTGEVPRSRGLGSSAICIVAGVLAAERLHGLALSPGDRLRLATEVEGHPDNVAPALTGGVVVSAMVSDGSVASCPVPLPAAGLPSLLVAIPDAALSTEAARAALPTHVPLQDAVFNASRTALLVAALASGRHDLLGEAFSDRLHQPYRAHLIPGVEGIMACAVESGALAAHVSGAGPTVMVIGPGDGTRAALRRHLADHPWEWTLRAVPVDTVGAVVV